MHSTWVAAAVVGICGVSLTACTSGSASPQPTPSSTQYVDEATLPTPTPGPNGNIPRPSEPAPLIAATGECETLLQNTRAIMDKYATGLDEMSKEDTREFNGYLDEINASKSGQGVCPADTASAFTIQEVGQWLLWEQPAPTPSPTSSQTRTVSPSGKAS